MAASRTAVIERRLFSGCRQSLVASGRPRLALFLFQLLPPMDAVPQPPKGRSRNVSQANELPSRRGQPCQRRNSARSYVQMAATPLHLETDGQADLAAVPSLTNDNLELWANCWSVPG